MSENQSEDLIQYLTFNLDDDVYGLNIRGIKEVLDNRDITKLPRTPDFMRGVINLRGQVVPVIDLKLKFGLEETQFTVETCIIIVEVELEDGTTTLLGALTDSVREVIELLPDDIDPPPKLGTGIDAAFIYGMGKFEDEFIIIINVKRLFTISELMSVASVPEGIPKPLEDEVSELS